MGEDAPHAEAQREERLAADPAAMTEVERQDADPASTPSAPASPTAGYARSTANATTLRVSRLNSTATRWIGSPRQRYLSA